MCEVSGDSESSLVSRQMISVKSKRREDPADLAEEKRSKKLHKIENLYFLLNKYFVAELLLRGLF